ncbi:DUF7079 family protein [Saccharospirillum mangrovi]|uniref:DUF7079 family protein n=1 Tax=Saccharospirillum mangrovi TaxID=2161747 RepID=UPI0013007A29|nr:hypothetical protein [Saccharospirillum mangrovi]
MGVLLTGKPVSNMIKEETRLPIWRALSDLFLDTEITDFTYQYIARTIRKSGLTVAEVEAILWHEVFPVLKSNLSSVAGVWDGWSDEWLLQHFEVREKPGLVQSLPPVIREIKACWAKVLTTLDNMDAD